MSFTEKFSESSGRLKMIRNATSNMILLLCDLKNCLKKDWSFVDWIKTDIRQKDKNSHTLRIKVIIRKSRGEASIIEQETTENVSAAYLKFRTFILCNSLVRGCYNIWKKNAWFFTFFWNFEFDELDFCRLHTELATQAVKIQFKLEKKNPIHQTWKFKLENLENQAQKDEKITIKSCS